MVDNVVRSVDIEDVGSIGDGAGYISSVLTPAYMFVLPFEERSPFEVT